MAKKVKVRTSKESRFNSSIIYSGNVKIKFNEEGIGKLEKSEVKRLLGEDSTLSVVKEDTTVKDIQEPEEIRSDEPKDTEKENVSITTSPDGESQSPGDSGDVESPEKIRKKLDELVVSDLQEMAKEIDKPEKDWKNLKKDDLITFIIDNS